MLLRHLLTNNFVPAGATSPSKVFLPLECVYTAHQVMVLKYW